MSLHVRSTYVQHTVVLETDLYKNIYQMQGVIFQIFSYFSTAVFSLKLANTDYPQYVD